MRILTVRQPYAWAIIHGGKDVENRVRNIAGSYRGPVAIHAALAFAQDYDKAKQTCDRLVPESEWDRPLYRGEIIGVVDLVDVHHGQPSDLKPPTCWQTCDDLGWMPFDRKDSWPDFEPRMCSEWGEQDAYHLVLANPRPLSEPIPYKGALGLRTVPPELQARIEAAL